MSAALGLVGAAGLGVLALLHVSWAAGGRWPGHDEESLARTVVGGPPGMRMPGPAACLAVAAALGVAALALLHCGGWVGPWLPAAWARGLALFSGGVLALRGGVGFLDARLRPATVGTPFARLNVRLYSPLALGLGAVALAAGGLAP